MALNPQALHALWSMTFWTIKCDTRPGFRQVFAARLLGLSGTDPHSINWCMIAACGTEMWFKQGPSGIRCRSYLLICMTLGRNAAAQCLSHGGPLSHLGLSDRCQCLEACRLPAASSWLQGNGGGDRFPARIPHPLHVPQLLLLLPHHLPQIVCNP